MREGPRSLLLPTVVVVAAVLVSGAVLVASKAIAQNFSLFVYLLADFVVCVDVLDFGLRIYFRRISAPAVAPGKPSATSVPLDLARLESSEKRLRLRPYALVVSVHNAERYLEDFLEAMQPCKDRLWVIDDGSTDKTYVRIRQAGWRCLKGGENRKKPGAIQTLLATLPPEIETVFVVDPDITIRDSTGEPLSILETVIFDFQRSGMAALCPRIAVRRDGFLSRLQGFEYCMAFSLGRKSLADHTINSGASIYRFRALASLLKCHSLSVYAEDLENSTILLGSGERIYYDGRLVAETPGKESWREWFSQRVGWAYGLIKVYTGRFEDIRRAARSRPSAGYQFLVYMGVFSILLHPFKVFAVILSCLSCAKGLDVLLGLGWIPDWSTADPVYFVAAILKYTVLSLAALLLAVPRSERSHLLPVVPLYFFYALAQVLAVSVGYANWLTLRLWGRRVWRDPYQDELSLNREYANGNFRNREQHGAG